MRSNAAIREHPLHPLLVAFPIGLWVTSLAWDIVYLSTRDPFWYNMAYWTILAGVVGGLVAAIPGFIDYFTLNLNERARRVATTHMALNLGALVLFLVSLWVRADSAAAGAAFGWVIALSVVIVGGLVFSGYLGAHLVHIEHVSVVEAPRDLAQAPRRAAGRLGLAGSLGGEAPAQEPRPGATGTRGAEDP